MTLTKEERLSLEALVEVTSYEDCTEAADWKDAKYRLIRLCRKALDALVTKRDRQTGGVS